MTISNRLASIGASVLILYVFWCWRDTIGQCGFIYEYFAVTTVVCGLPKKFFDDIRPLRVIGAAVWGLYAFFMIWCTKCGMFWVQHFWMFWLFHFAFLTAMFALLDYFLVPYKVSVKLECEGGKAPNDTEASSSADAAVVNEE